MAPTLPFPTKSGELPERPPLWGRDDAIRGIDAHLVAARSGTVGGPLLFSGPAGTGRTTLLNLTEELTRQAGGVAARSTTLDRAIEKAWATLAKRDRDLAHAVAADAERLAAATGEAVPTIRRLGELARRHGTVITVLVANADTEVLRQLGAVTREARQAGDPLVVAATTAEDVASYQRTHPLHDPTIITTLPLAPKDAQRFLRAGLERVRPAAYSADTPLITEEAFALLVTASGGFTDLLATYGNEAWLALARRSRPHGVDSRRRRQPSRPRFPITAQDVTIGIQRATARGRVARGVIASRQQALVPRLPAPLYAALRALAYANPHGATMKEIAGAIDPATGTTAYPKTGDLLTDLTTLSEIGFTTAHEGVIRIAHGKVITAVQNRSLRLSRARNDGVSAGR